MAPHRIDTHNHPYPPAYVEKTRSVLKATTHAFYERIIKWEPAQTVEAMDKNGIAVSVLSIGTPNVWLDNDAKASSALARDCNEQSAKMQRDYKGRFGHFATLALPDTDGALREIEYVFDTLKADGVGLQTNYGDKWPGDPAYKPIFDELNRRKSLVYFHPLVAACCGRLSVGTFPAVIEVPHDTTRAVVSRS